MEARPDGALGNMLSLGDAPVVQRFYLAQPENGSLLLEKFVQGLGKNLAQVASLDLMKRLVRILTVASFLK
jgi:hypothetical protein